MSLQAGNDLVPGLGDRQMIEVFEAGDAIAPQSPALGRRLEGPVQLRQTPIKVILAHTTTGALQAVQLPLEVDGILVHQGVYFFSIATDLFTAVGHFSVFGSAFMVTHVNVLFDHAPPHPVLLPPGEKGRLPAASRLP